MSVIDTLRTKALQIKGEILLKANTALRVGGLFEDVVTYLKNLGSMSKVDDVAVAGKKYVRTTEGWEEATGFAATLHGHTLSQIDPSAAADGNLEDIDYFHFSRAVSGTHSWFRVPWVMMKAWMGINVMAGKTLTVINDACINDGIHSGNNTGDQMADGVTITGVGSTTNPWVAVNRIPDHSTTTNRDVAGNHAKLIPISNTINAIQFLEADAITEVVNIDTLNHDLEIKGTISPALKINKNAYAIALSPLGGIKFNGNAEDTLGFVPTFDSIENGIYCMAVFGAYIYIGTFPNGKILRSLDGVTFVEVFDSTKDTSIFVMCVFGGYLYAGGGNFGKVIRTSDGITWTEVFSAEVNMSIKSMNSYKGYLYFGTQLGSASKIYRSLTGDSGSWGIVYTTTASLGIDGLVEFNGYIYASADIDQNLGNIYKSLSGDLGSWGLSGSVPNGIYCMSVHGNHLYVGTYNFGKLYRSIDGNIFIEVLDLPESYVCAICSYKGYMYISSYSSGCIYRSVSGDSGSWVLFYDSVEQQMECFATWGNYLYAGGIGLAKVYRYSGDSTNSEFAKIRGYSENQYTTTIKGGLECLVNVAGVQTVKMRLLSTGLNVIGSVQVAYDTTVASAANAGAIRYGANANNSYLEVCMRIGASTWAWTLIKVNSWA